MPRNIEDAGLRLASFAYMMRQQNESPARFGEVMEKIGHSPQNTEILTRVAAAILQGEGVKEMTSAALKVLGERSGFQAVLLYLLDDEKEVLRLDALYAAVPTLAPPATLPLSHGSLISRSARMAETYAIEDIGSAAFADGVEQSATRGFLQALQSRATMCVPLQARGRILGVLVHASARPIRYSPSDTALFELVGEFIAHGILNFRTLENERLARAEVQAVAKAALSIAAGADLATILRLIVEESRTLVNARYAALGVIDEADPLSQFRPWVFSGVSEEQAHEIGHPPRAIGLLGTVPLEGRSIRVRELADDPRFHGFPPGHPRMHSFLGVPINYNGRSLGNLYLGEKIGADEFSDADRRAVELLAEHAAIALGHAKAKNAWQEAEEKVEAQKAQQGYSARLLALGEMAAGIAHEVNNPLSVILSLVQYVNRTFESRTVTPEEFKPIAERIEDRARKIGNIVDGLRSFARESPENFEEVGIQALVDGAVELSGARLKHHGIRLSVQPIAEDIQLECRPAQISQVLVNLLNNAHDAVLNLPQKWVTLAVNATDEEVVISVTDSGRGIPVELRDRIMEPFFTTKQYGEGTGLGLSISRGIAEAHGGSLELDTTSSRTCFRLRLPRKHRAG